MRVLVFTLILLSFSALAYWFGVARTEDRIKEKNHQELLRAIREYVDSDDSTLHVCKDPTHQTCYRDCSCFGAYCLVRKRDYQIELHGDTVWIFDADRPVGRYISNWHNQMDTILLKDNE